MGLTRPRFEQINSIITTISDPITVLNQGSTQANIDVGFIINRNGGALANTAIFWNESANTFVTAFTAASGATNANVSISEYANLRVNTLNSTFVNATGNILTAQLNAGQINTTGNIVSGGNVTVGNMIVPTGAGRFNGPFNESTTIAGVYVGNLNLSPRIGFFNGTAAQNWQIDNNFGSFRWYTPGVVRMTIDTGGNLNVPSGNIMSSGNVTARYFFGNGSQLSGVITSVTKIINGTSDVTAYSGGNVAVTVGGTANTVVFTSSNIHITGSIIPSANVTYDLGSSSNRFRSAYFAGSTIYLGNSIISESTIASIPSFPSGDYGDIGTSSSDAFGVQSVTSFDLNAAGAVSTIDLEVLS
jgi:hypothetical protein